VAKEPKPPCPRPGHEESHVVLDKLPFRINIRDKHGMPLPAGPVIFQILAAYGRVEGEPHVLAMRGAPDAAAQNWDLLFRALDGQPERVVCDAHSGLLAGVRASWPGTAIYYSEWHLKDKMRKRLRRAKMHVLRWRFCFLLLFRPLAMPP
jgi:hypothetical protein